VTGTRVDGSPPDPPLTFNMPTIQAAHISLYLPDPSAAWAILRARLGAERSYLPPRSGIRGARLCCGTSSFGVQFAQLSFAALIEGWDPFVVRAPLGLGVGP
jgi:hypothetical protein